MNKKLLLLLKYLRVSSKINEKQNSLVNEMSADLMVLVELLLVQQVASQDEVEVHAESVSHLADQVQPARM